MSQYLLDTNAISAYFADDKPLLEILEKADEIFLPSIALGELYYGAEKSSRKNDNLQRIELLSLRMVILDCNKDSARIYGRLKLQLQQKGRPIKDNDVWIAAIGIQYQLTVVTRDKHFGYVDDLKAIAW